MGRKIQVGYVINISTFDTQINFQPITFQLLFMNKPLIFFTRIFLTIVIFSCTASAQLTVQTESFDATAFTPAGWSLNPNPGLSTAVWTRRTTGNTQLAVVPHSGAAMASFRSTNFGNPPGNSVSGDFQSLITPMFDLSSRGAAVASVSFWMFRDSLLATNEDSLSVYINTTDSLSGASWIGTVVRNSSIAIPNTEALNGWYMYTFYYPASFTGASNYILFKGVAEQGVRIYIDDVSYDTYPYACNGVPFVGNIVNPLPIICNGGGSTILSLEFALSGGGLSYDWQMSNSATGPWNSIGTGADTLHTPNLSSTTYFQCIVNCNASGLSDTTAIDSVTISSNTSPVVSVSGTTTFCQGSNSLFVASGASTYSWSPNSTLTNVGESDMDSLLAAPTVNTTYLVSGTDLSGCVGTSNVIVTVNPAPVLNATAYEYATGTVITNPIICLGDSLRLNAIPFGGGNPWTYLWNDGATTRIDSIFPLVTTTYIVTATVTATGCTANDTIVITVNSGTPPVISISPTGPLTVCNGVGVQIIASGATDYLWSPSLGLNTVTNDTIIASPTASTMYIVSATNNGSCVAKDTIQINAGISPVATATLFAGNDTICTNTEIILQGGPNGAGNNSFAWSNGSVTANDTISPTSSGTYSVTVTNAVGCSDTASIYIQVDPGTPPTISISPVGTLHSCDGTPVQVTASGTGTGYSWSPALGLDATTGTVVNAAPTATTNYTVTSVLGNCSSYLTFSVLAGTSPALNATAYDFHTGTAIGDSICGVIGDTIRLNAIPFGGNNPWSYLWNNGHTVRIDTVVLNATTTTFTVMATNNLTGCVGYDTIVITLTEPPVANFSFTNSGNDYSFSDLSAGSINSWFWNFGDGNNATAPNPNYTFTNAGTYIVKLVVNGPCGVDSSEQTIVIDGISGVNASLNFSCFPNPTNDELNFSFNCNDRVVNYSIVNILNQELMTGILNASVNHVFTTKLSLKDLSAGTYMLHLKSASQSTIVKLKKQ